MRFMLLQNYGEVESDCAPMTQWSPEDIKAHIEFQQALNAELAELGEFVDAQGLAGPELAIVVTTVYDPSDGAAAVPGSGLSPWPEGPRLLAELNSVLAEAAGRHGAFVADVHTHFQGHGVATGDPAQPHPRPANRKLWYCGVIEPNAWGAHEIRSVWWHTLCEPSRVPRRR